MSTMTENDFVDGFEHVPDEISMDEEIAESPPKSGNSKDKHRLMTRRRLEEIMEAKKLYRELNDFDDNEPFDFYKPFDYFADDPEVEERRH